MGKPSRTIFFHDMELTFSLDYDNCSSTHVKYCLIIVNPLFFIWKRIVHL